MFLFIQHKLNLCFYVIFVNFGKSIINVNEIYILF